MAECDEKTIYVDTREHEQERLRVMEQIHKRGRKTMLKKLDVGDYALHGNDKVAVDRKKNLDELAKNMCTKDSGRFWREIRRAHERGIKLYILCEHGGKYHTLEDVQMYKSKYMKNLNGRDLADRMFRLHVAYGVEFVFCGKKDTGKTIIKLLEGFGNDGALQGSKG